MHTQGCIFCEKDTSKERFEFDYVLLPWRNDPTNKHSKNKIAKIAHNDCLSDFMRINDFYDRDTLEDIIATEINQREA